MLHQVQILLKSHHETVAPSQAAPTNWTLFITKLLKSASEQERLQPVDGLKQSSPPAELAHDIVDGAFGRRYRRQDLYVRARCYLVQGKAMVTRRLIEVVDKVEVNGVK
eukprot:4828239-Amphidinium_carterae.1